MEDHEEYVPPDADDILALIEVVDSLADLVAKALEQSDFSATARNIAERARYLYRKSVGTDDSDGTG